MYEHIKYWLLDLRPNWQMVQHIRGVVRDRKGKLYWLYIHEVRTGSFRIRLYAWPSLSFFDELMVGWIAFGVTQNPTSWRIGDVRVRCKQRGIGTVLVKATIALARRRGAQELRGVVTVGDAGNSPFLTAWYARLGFTVQSDEGDGSATFCMDLTRQR